MRGMRKAAADALTLPSNVKPKMCAAVYTYPLKAVPGYWKLGLREKRQHYSECKHS